MMTFGEDGICVSMINDVLSIAASHALQDVWAATPFKSHSLLHSPMVNISD